MNIDWSAVLTGVIAFALALLIKTLLDLKLAHFLVKYFHWLPVRNIFREKPIDLSGKWEQIWGSADSLGFQNPVDRHSYPKIRQLGNYCFAEFDSKGVEYRFFGKIQGEHLIGDWCDSKDSAGYFGAFHLLIVDSSNLRGKWIGHSKSSRSIQGDEWIWEKLT